MKCSTQRNCSQISRKLKYISKTLNQTIKKQNPKPNQKDDLVLATKKPMCMYIIELYKIMHLKCTIMLVLTYVYSHRAITMREIKTGTPFLSHKNIHAAACSINRIPYSIKSTVKII
jgi:hypothetical protein